MKTMKKKRNNVFDYSTAGKMKTMLGYSKEIYNGYLNRLKYTVDWSHINVYDVYNGLRIVKVRFKEPYLLCGDCEVIALLVMKLLMMYAYNTQFEYDSKFTIGYVMKIPTGDVVTYTLGRAISLFDSGGNAVPNMDLYAKIYQLIMKKAEHYEKAVLSGVSIRMYLVGMQEKESPLGWDEIDTVIFELITSGIFSGEPPEVKSWGRKRGYPNYIPALKPTSKERQPFIVADTETLMRNDVHVPYAAGFLVVKPGEDVGAKPSHSIETYFSEDHLLLIPQFEERSARMLFDFLERLAVVAAETQIRTVYFHNFSRFDGIILMKDYASHGFQYKIKPLIRNHMLYELAVYQGRKLVFRLRDSYTLLPSSLDKLSKALCPQLGSKGSIQHDKVEVSNLKKNRAELLDYMIQDIRLSGGVMLKAQEIYWTEYNVDIVNYLTLSALSLAISRMSYYDPNSWPIHIPSRNEDTFIRRGYYGGHADVYKPYGKNLHYYDVNSLYPYIMKTYSMPGGVPVWNGHLEGQELSNLYGFIEAYVECPRTLTRPFLPYRDENETLLFPTGEFVGVFFSEELIFARDLGYEIRPLRGYLFEKKTSPFDSFVSSVFGKRQEAKKTGNSAMEYGYKILMNSLYGRFGINPQSTITEVCNRSRYDDLMQRDNILNGDKLSDDYYIVTYVSNTVHSDDIDWNPPKISAVQLAAAITACSRIMMYKYISRPDCYYTDTDSAILGSPLPDDEVSSIELGKLKKEHFVKRGIFLAPKSYAFETDAGDEIIKHKGPAKDLVNFKWFESQYADLSQTKQIPVESKFRIDWETLNIGLKKNLVNLGIKPGTKREVVYDENNRWVDTLPKHVIDLGGQDNEIQIFKLKKEYAQSISRLKSELAKEREENQLLSAKLEIVKKSQLPEEQVMSPLTESPTVSEQPTLDKHQKPKGKKPKPKPKEKDPVEKKPKGKKPP